MAGAPKHIGFLRIVLRRSVMGKTAPVTAERAQSPPPPPLAVPAAARKSGRSAERVHAVLWGPPVQMRDTVKALGFGPKGLVNSEVRTPQESSSAALPAALPCFL
jgi:hypothetical protein